MTKSLRQSANVSEARGLQIESPLGPISLFETDGFLTSLDLQPLAISSDPTPLLQRAAAQLNEYFNRTRRTFDLPLRPFGTEFQRTAWAVLELIPYGQTLSYKAQAAQMGQPLAQRAVGQANGENPLPILIPCHRVIRSNGELGGYAGGREIKQFLINLEASFGT